MNGSSDEPSIIARPRHGVSPQRFLWTLSSAPALSLILSLLVHGGVVTVLIATAFRPSSRSPQLLVPEGVAMAEVHQVERPARHVAPAPPPTPDMSLPPIRIVPLTQPQPVDDTPPSPPEPLPAPPQASPDPPPVMDVASENVTEAAEPSLVASPEPAAETASTATVSAPAAPSNSPAAPAAPTALPAAPASDSGPNLTQGVRTGVRLVAWPEVRYPPSCRRRGEEGLVKLEVEVLADGRVGRITVLQHAKSPKLDEAALDAVRQATFAPATVDGWPVVATVIVPVRFAIR